MKLLTPDAASALATARLARLARVRATHASKLNPAGVRLLCRAEFAAFLELRDLTLPTDLGPFDTAPYGRAGSGG